MAAPSKLTDEVRVKLKEAAALDATIEEMAFYCDVSRQTLYNWFQEDRELFDEIERLRQRPVLKARQTIVKALENPTHAFRYLERKRKKEFGPSVDMTTPQDETVRAALDAIQQLANGGSPTNTNPVQGERQPADNTPEVSAAVQHDIQAVDAAK